MNEARDFPKTYSVFEGKSKDGAAPRKYWIQDATEEFFDEMVECLQKYFPREEPISKYKKGYTDEISASEVRDYNNQILKEKVSLVCLTKDDKDNNGGVKLAGFNMLTIAKKEEEDEDFHSDGWFLPFMIGIFDCLESKRNVFEEFQIDKCLKAVGLFVLPEYRREGLAEQILKARIPLCKSLNIKVSLTIFTSTLSQKAAYKAGFKDFYAIDYADLFAEKPEFHIPGIEEHSKSIKLLYLNVE